MEGFPREYDQVFVGRLFALGLRPRGRDDQHVVIDFLIGSQGHGFRFPDITTGVSGFWCSEIIDLYSRARDWMTEFCVPEVDPPSESSGWVFGRNAFYPNVEDENGAQP